jgi:hypothetical protein
MSLEHAPQRDRRRLRRNEASVYLKEEHQIDRSPNTLAKLAVIGGGPAMVYVGRFPTYTPDALDDYARSIISMPVRNTAEPRQSVMQSGKAA